MGGGEEESLEAMSEAASEVYEMLLSSDCSILDIMMVMVELLARRLASLGSLAADGGRA